MNKVLIKGWYNSKTCPYCKMTEDLLKKNFKNINIIKEDIYPNPVPKIFVIIYDIPILIGGYSDLQIFIETGLMEILLKHNSKKNKKNSNKCFNYYIN